MTFKQSDGRQTRAVPAALAILALLGGCDKLTSNGTSDTLSLLHAGSDKVCVAGDVEKSLHKLIVPKVDNVNSQASDDDKLAALGTISVSFDLATLQGFDKAVSKASCNATVEISGPKGASRRFDLNYKVSPSAQDPSDFIVTIGGSDAQIYAATLAGSAADDTAARKAEIALAAQQEQARAQLLATISPKWLIGTWLVTSQGSSACANGEGLTLEPAHILRFGDATGRWAIKDDQLHIAGSGSGGTFDRILTITQADAVSFTTSLGDSDTTSWRRCSHEEINAQSDIPAVEPDGSEADPNDVVPSADDH